MAVSTMYLKLVSQCRLVNKSLDSSCTHTHKKRESSGIEISFVPIPSVGCYIPGGQARYPSSVIMSVITCKKAGVKRIVVVSPPNRDGKIDPLTIAVAAKIVVLLRFTRLVVHKQLAALGIWNKIHTKS